MNPTRNFRNYALAAVAGAVLASGGFAAFRSGQASVAASAPVPAPVVSAQARLAEVPVTKNTADLRALDESFADLAEFVAPAVVDIKSVTERRQDSDGRMVPVAGGEGSGFIFRKDGWIMTNDHVVAGYDKVTVTLRDGREFVGKVTRAPEKDLAVIKIEATDLPTLAFADSAKIRPGQFAMAVGAPFGLDQSVTIGHVSALHRRDQIVEGRVYSDLIQTDTAINQGNSGGPLLNSEGQVIGVNTVIISPSGGSAGIGFAIPATSARTIGERLVAGGKIERAYMGVVPETVKAYRATEMGIPGGAVLTTVQSDGPAAVAGLKEGDVVTEINGRPVATGGGLRDMMFEVKAGETATVTYYRGKERGTANVKVTAPPKETVRDLTPDRSGQGRQFRFGPGGDLPDDLFRQFGRDFGGMSPRDEVVPAVPNDGKPRLGVMVGDISDEMRRQFSIPKDVRGAIVQSVTPGSPAADLGLRTGDVVTRFGGTAIGKGQDLVSAVGKVKKGQSVTVTFSRFGERGRMDSTATVEF